MDIATFVIFGLEAIMKMYAFGFCHSKKSYFKQNANIFDFVLVMIQFIGLLNVSSFKIFKVFRLLRVIRPLRIINKNDGLKVAFRTLMHAIPQIINLTIVSLVFYFLFGIFSVSLLKGVFYHCNFDMIEFNIIGETQTKWDCLNRGALWEKHWLNFDNSLQGMITLYVMGSVSWIKTMWAAVDSVGVNKNPQLNNSEFWIIYFVVIVVIFNFFIMNLIIGVIVSTFKQEKAKIGKKFLLTEN